MIFEPPESVPSPIKDLNIFECGETVRTFFRGRHCTQWKYQGETKTKHLEEKRLEAKHLEAKHLKRKSEG